MAHVIKKFHKEYRLLANPFEGYVASPLVLGAFRNEAVVNLSRRTNNAQPISSMCIGLRLAAQLRYAGGHDVSRYFITQFSPITG